MRQSRILLWLLSFVLHGVLLYAVIILYTRFSALKETERQQKKILEETENTLAAFLLELKEENERLEDAKSRQAPDAEDAEPRPEPKEEPSNECAPLFSSLSARSVALMSFSMWSGISGSSFGSGRGSASSASGA